MTGHVLPVCNQKQLYPHTIVDTGYLPSHDFHGSAWKLIFIWIKINGFVQHKLWEVVKVGSDC